MPEASDDTTPHEAERLDGPALEALARMAKPPPLRALGWQSPDDCWHRETGYSEETRAAIAAVARLLPKLPELRRLEIHGTDSWIFEEMRPDEFLWPWQGTQIRELKTYCNDSQLGAWIEQFLASQLTSLELSMAGGTATLTRESAGVRLELEFCSNNHKYFRPLVDGLERFPAGSLAALVLTCDDRVYIKGNRQRIERLGERHPGLAFERRSIR